MRIKRFVAPDMRTAFRLVREEQGPEAVILSNRQINGGVEVVAATDYDEALVQQALRAALPSAPPGDGSATNPTPSAATATATASAPANKLRPVSAPAPNLQSLWTDDPILNQMRQELAAMRETIEREMGRFTEERLRGAPARSAALDILQSYGCDETLAREVVQRIPADTDLTRGRGMMLAQLGKMLPLTPAEPLDAGGVIALIGPTGAGKTTTLAKLAARYASRHSARDVALISTDSHRIGAREQLNTYGRLLGMAVFEADGQASLAQMLDRLADYRLILIDTAGYGPRDRALAGQINWLRAAQRVRSLLVMPANSQAGDLDEVVRRYHGAAPEAAILTKLDETGQMGGVLSVIVRHHLPLAYLTDGQRVPEDLHRALAPQLVLRCEEIRRAADKSLIPEENHAAA